MVIMAWRGSIPAPLICIMQCYALEYHQAVTASVTVGDVHEVACSLVSESMLDEHVACSCSLVSVSMLDEHVACSCSLVSVHEHAWPACSMPLLSCE